METRTNGYKPFSQKTYNRTDNKGKETAIMFLLEHGFNFTEEQLLKNEQERYKICDFEITKKDTKKSYLIEVEVREMWIVKGKWMKYNTVHIPGRKNETQSDIYIVINSTHDTIGICKTENILNSPIITINTRSTINENFYDVKLCKFRFFDKQYNSEWKLIKN